MSDHESWDDFSDEEEVPLSQNAHKKSKDPSEYRIKGALKVPHLVSYTAQSLFGLIDSYFRNYFVPPVIFVVKREDDGAEKRVCIDGKQRLTSIWRFMDGLIPYKDPFTGEKFTYKSSGKSKSNTRLLPERYRKIFRNKQIACMEYDQLSDDNEREIFQRVQLGMALTPAEKMQAINSPTATFIRELAREYVTDGLADLLEWDTNRGSDFRSLTTAVFAIQKWKSLSTPPSPAQLTTFLQQHEDLEESFCQRVRQTLAIFVALAQDKDHQKAFHISGIKKVAPVEFTMTCVLISAHKDKLTLSQLGDVILQMRKDVRKVEQDIRMNGRVVKHMIAFIKAIKTSSLKSNGHPIASIAVPALTRKKRPMLEDGSSDSTLVESKRSKTTTSKFKSDIKPASSQVSFSSNQDDVNLNFPPPQSGPLQPATILKSSSAEMTEIQQLSRDRLAAIKAAKGSGSVASSISKSLSSSTSKTQNDSHNQSKLLGGSLMERMQIPSETGSLYYQENLQHHLGKPSSKNQGWKGHKK
ncbi:hypothetical protein NLI96_g2734 [Meripilus lineatus]|uniref:GmrSD restriction endonucleases N-terminal domain-containing protein n=1 Tax=Meripilus lineatus TaxID=2056292 RepID=A0AAD5V8A2_9APHY|nr:hypothetical protein NLI96_g2734 [Physisporinus lineatus]